MNTLSKSNTILLGVGDLQCTREAGSLLKAMALGSCIAVIMLDPRTRTVGMVHVALPESRVEPDRAKNLPGFFADTGIPALVAEMERQGCKGNGEGWIVKLVGGASFSDTIKTLDIGAHNAEAVKKLLCSYRFATIAEDLGKNISRTVTVNVDCGQVKVSSPGRGDWEI